MDPKKNFITTKHIIYTLLVLCSIALSFTVFLPWPYNIAPFGVIIGLTIFIVNFKYPMIGVYLYMFIFFFNPQEFIPVELPYEKAIALMILVVLFFKVAFRDKKFELYPMDKAFAAFMVVCFVSIMFAGDIELAWDTFFKFFKVFLVYLFASRLADTQKKFNTVIWIYLLSVVYIAVSVSLNYYIAGGAMNMGVERAGGFGEGGEDPNSIANSLLLGIPFFYYLYRHYKNFYIRAFFVGIMLLSVWTIVLTGSRGGMLGVMVVAILLSLATRYKIVTSFIAIMFIGVFLIAMPDQYKERFGTIFSVYDSNDTTGANESAQGRIEGLVKGFVFLSQRPLFGVGIGNFKWQNRVQYGKWLDSHNLIGKLVGELGIAGIISFGFFLYTIIATLQMIKYIYHKYKWEYDFNWYLVEAIFYSLIILAYQGLISHNLFRDNWYAIACFVVIMSTLIKNRVELEKSRKHKELDVTDELPQKI
ncbi:MAG: hypothetical protein DWP97_11275 [Calditrichaeota bacterium]|nr:MAG: hypothetical protein DWP97_11275 [Calditrichota bacterium]